MKQSEPRVTVTLNLSLREAIRVIGVLRIDPDAIRIENTADVESPLPRSKVAIRRTAIVDALKDTKIEGRSPAPPKVKGRPCATCGEIKPWVREGGSCKDCREAHDKIVVSENS